jgi:hypothetical protein
MLNYPQSSYHVYWHIALIYVANAVLTTSTDIEWRFYFLLCLQGYSRLSPVYGFASVCYKGLLTIAIKSKKISAEEGRRLLDQLGEKQDRQSHSARNLGVRLAITNKSSTEGSVKAEELAKDFDRISLAQEGTGS